MRKSVQLLFIWLTLGLCLAGIFPERSYSSANAQGVVTVSLAKKFCLTSKFAARVKDHDVDA